MSRRNPATDSDAKAAIFWQFVGKAAEMGWKMRTLEGRENMRAFWKQAASWGRWNFVLTTVSVTPAIPSIYAWQGGTARDKSVGRYRK